MKEKYKSIASTKLYTCAIAFIRCYTLFAFKTCNVQSSLILLVSFAVVKNINEDTKDITKTRLYNFDPLKPHFYIVKLGFTGVYIIVLISAQKIDCGYS